MKIYVSKQYANLKPSVFEKWFKKHWPDADWEEYYKAIGGKIEKKKPIEKKK